MDNAKCGQLAPRQPKPNQTLTPIPTPPLLQVNVMDGSCLLSKTGSEQLDKRLNCHLSTYPPCPEAVPAVLLAAIAQIQPWGIREIGATNLIIDTDTEIVGSHLRS